MIMRGLKQCSLARRAAQAEVARLFAGLGRALLLAVRRLQARFALGGEAFARLVDGVMGWAHVMPMFGVNYVNKGLTNYERWGARRGC